MPINATENFKLAPTITIEAIGDESVAIYNDKYACTQIISSSFMWLIELLESPVSYSKIVKQYNLLYFELMEADCIEQIDNILDVFLHNNIITKVA